MQKKLNQDEFIEFYEFLMLNQHMEKGKWTFAEVRKIFIEESDCIAPLTNEKALSFDKFIDISIDFNLFSEQKTQEFLQGSIAEDLVSFEDIKEHSKERFDLLKLRFIKGKNYTSHFKRIIDNLEAKLKKPTMDERNKRIVLMSYRLVDEESKMAVVE